ncbi:MAG: glycosyltransferase [Halobacteriales archaeon]|nr:glycosyltransferase [Halobacteriales archaeon]
MSDLSDEFVSVVAPLRDDADIVGEFVREVDEVLRRRYATYEIVLVDDGSEDDTAREVGELLAEFDSLRFVRLSREFGQENAISAGLETVIGDYAVVMLPATDPPKLLPRMIRRCRGGAAIVFGVRDDRGPEPSWLRWGAAAFYWLCNRVLGMNLLKNSTHFRVLDRRALNALLRVRDRRRYLRTLSAYVGYPSQSIRYEPIQRRSPPRTKGVWESVNLAIDIVVANTTRPLRLVSWLGLAVSGFSVLYMGYIVIVYLVKDRVAEGWATQSMQVAITFLFVSIILVALTEYVGRLLDEVQDRPLYYVMEEETGSADPGATTRLNVVEDSVERDLGDGPVP